MGLLNPAVAKVASEALSLMFLTGTLSKVAGHLASALKGEKPGNGQGPLWIPTCIVPRVRLGFG